MSRVLHISRAFVALLIPISVGLLSGCSTPRSKSGPQRMPPQPVLIADQTFAETGIVVSAELGPFRRPRPEEESNASASPRSEGKSRRSPPPGGGQRERPEGRAARATSGGAGAGRTARVAPMRQNLIVTIHNPTDSTVSLDVDSVESLLGSFVPVPGSMTLPPGESQSLENMRANYPANFDALELTIRIRTAKTDETQILVLTPDPNQPSPPAHPEDGR